MGFLSKVFKGVSSLFSPKQKSASVSVAADPYGGVRNDTLQFVQGGLQAANDTQAYKPKAYDGEIVAPMSEAEQKSMDFLKQYQEQPQSQTFKLGADEINKTLSGDYDPTTSPYYQAVKAEASRNLDETQKNIASNAAGGGRYWSGARLAEQGDASIDVTNSLNRLLGEMSERERERRLGVLPMAAEFARSEEEAPLRKAAASQELGALPRAIQQALNQAKYNDWLRVNVDQPFALAQMGAGLQGSPMYAQNGYTPSTFSQIVQAAPTIKSVLSDLFKKNEKT